MFRSASAALFLLTSLASALVQAQGAMPGFEFSAAMQQTGIVWDYATLDDYLADTERAIPGKAMNFMGIPDPALRAAAVAYLRTLNDAPPPLPQ